MAEITMGRNSWFLFQKESRTDVFAGKIVDFSKGEDDIYWFLFKLEYNLSDMRTIDEPQDNQPISYFENSRQFRVLTEGELEDIRNSVRRNEESVEPTRDQVEPEAAEEATRPDYTTISCYPQFVPHQDYEPRTSYTLNLGSGDMKSLIKLAEKVPELVWDQIDKSVEEVGHLVFSYMSARMAQKFIDLKVENLSSWIDIDVEVNQVYDIEKNDKVVRALFLGDNHWHVFSDDALKIPGLGSLTQLVSINQEEYQDLNITKVSGSVELLIAGEMEKIALISPDLLERIQNVGHTIKQKNPTPDAKIVAEILGDKWVDAITYYYFGGGEFKWDNFDLETFSTFESIKKLIEVRKEAQLMKYLEAA